MTDHILAPDTQAILLLCGSFGPRSAADPKPLTTAEYNRLAQWLHEEGRRPAELLQPHPPLPDGAQPDPALDPSRLLALLERGAALALAVEDWTNRGLWVLSRGDEPYPRRLKTRLGRAAPPLLYGAGDPALLSGGGLAVVGSREMDAPAEEFAQRVGALAGRQELPVISGGARGIDSTAMQAALAEGGRAVGILSDRIEKAAVSPRYRAAIQQGVLVLASPFEPAAPFLTWRAMERNKYIYALSDWALVVSAAAESGGTRAGALENLKAGWVPLFVRDGGSAPAGNQALIRDGGIALALAELPENGSLREWLDSRSTGTAASGEVAAPAAAETTDARAAGKTTIGEGEPAARGAPEATDLFEVVWPHIAAYLTVPRREKELASLLALEPAQLRAWLARAIERGYAEKLSKPICYVATTAGSDSAQLELIG